MQSGFYWAKRRGSGTLTVIEFTDSFGVYSFNLLGTDHCPAQHEIEDMFEVLDRIPEPAA